jgi:hypothetical protein
MRSLLVGLMVLALFSLPNLAFANCYNETVMLPNGGMQICQVCCINGAGCTRHCM